MLDLGPQGEPYSLTNQRDLILQKGAEQFIGTRGGIEGQDGRIVERVPRPVVAQAPNHVVAFAGPEVMLQVDIEGIPILVGPGFLAPVGVVVKLQSEVGGR